MYKREFRKNASSPKSHYVKPLEHTPLHATWWNPTNVCGLAPWPLLPRGLPYPTPHSPHYSDFFPKFVCVPLAQPPKEVLCLPVKRKSRLPLSWRLWTFLCLVHTSWSAQVQILGFSLTGIQEHGWMENPTGLIFTSCEGQLPEDKDTWPCYFGTSSQGQCGGRRSVSRQGSSGDCKAEEEAVLGLLWVTGYGPLARNNVRPKYVCD